MALETTEQLLVVMAPILIAVVQLSTAQFLQFLLVPIFDGILSFFISLCLSYLRPCKSLITNVSLSFHIMQFGTLAITTRLWYEGSSFSTEVLAIMFVVPMAIPHIVIVMWTFYKLVYCVNSQCGHQFKTVPTTLRKVALLLRNRHDYQELL